MSTADAAQIDEYVPIADARTGLPESLQGIFWMDGNPLPDKVVSFAASTWDAENRRTSIKVYGEGIWSWPWWERGGNMGSI